MQDQWSTMAKFVRDFDEEKVKDSREDIDTLLVFAGLFSAILTAFLVAAYPSMRPPSSESAISSTTPPIQGSSASSFSPTRTNVVVNILWFASLVIGLATASLGILVKQWLHEYLAVENPSPQARLRLRHSRHPQIKKWMVYEIAAFLPFLLQIALLFFFLLGLCCFAASIHSSLRSTTLVLVISWALLAFAAIIFPLFYPDCPYRTSLLSGLSTRSHNLLPSSKFFESFPSHEISNDHAILLSVDAIQANDVLLITSIVPAMYSTNPDWEKAVYFAMRIIGHRVQSLPLAERGIPEWPFGGPSSLASIPPSTMDGILQIFSRCTADSCIHADYSSPANPDEEGQNTSALILRLCAFAMVISRAMNFTQPLPEDAIVFLRAHLTAKKTENRPAALYEKLLQKTMYWGNSSSMVPPVSEGMVHLLDIITDHMELLDLSLKDGETCFTDVQSTLPDAIQLTDQWYQEWEWPMNIPLKFKNSCLRYLFRLVTLELRSPKMLRQSTTVARQAKLRSLLGLVLRLASTLDSSRVPNSHWEESQILVKDCKVWIAFEAMIVAALSSTAGLALIADCLMDDGMEGCWHNLCVKQEFMPEEIQLPEEHMDNIHKYVSKMVLNQKMISLLTVLQVCHAAIVLLILVGHTAGSRKKGRVLFTSLAAHINSALELEESSNQNNSADIDQLANDCLIRIHDEETFYMEDSYRNRDELWEQMFSEEDSIFPDVLVRSLGQFTIHDRSRLFRLGD
ncbi:hypothetical protein BDY19DRAFT_144375 [Irpex rosettiformis]|uniref:Uncharacterized protein n=1 Tax=Irpex rosettiformis TaxID=378272 RepID=A0ACB8U3B3_9APHY|nr:hypothetical protein BDY19DRAFT_144375 [Irpex rosettiformis]